jgi:hypothetical protein
MNEDEKREMKRKSLFGGLKTKVRTISEKTSAVGQQAVNVVSQEKAPEAAKNLLNLVTKIARDARNNLDPDMVKAIDLSVYVSLVAVRIGVSVDLEKLQPKITIRQQS